MMGEGEGDSLWFTYLLNPSKLATDLEAGPSTQELQPLLKDLLTNLLNNQQAGFFTDNPQELWFAKSRERKSLVLRNLSLQVTMLKFYLASARHRSWLLLSLYICYCRWPPTSLGDLPRLKPFCHLRSSSICSPLLSRQAALFI